MTPVDQQDLTALALVSSAGVVYHERQLGPIAQEAATPSRHPAGEMTSVSRHFASFAEFYPFYLGEHANLANRRLHFLGTSLAILCLLLALLWESGWPVLVALVSSYGCAWVGHYFFEKNTPATFTHPFYSFVGDWVMYKDILAGRLRI